MINFKKTSTIKIDELTPKLGEGFSFKDFSVLNNGNICMIFEKKLSENERRYVIKIHTRVGLQRQCSFTAIDSTLVNAFLYRGELYAFFGKEGGPVDLSLARLEPDTKENLVDIKEGEVVSFANKGKDFFVLGYSDGSIVKYEKGKPEVLCEKGKGNAFVSFDCNERLMWTDLEENKVARKMVSKAEKYDIDLAEVSSFMISRDDKSAFIFKDGKIYSLSREKEEGRDVFKDPKETDLKGKICRMNKSTLALLDDNIITVGTI